MALGLRGQYYRYREFSLNLLAIYKQRSDVQAFLEIILSLSTLIVFIVFAIKPTALTMISLNKEITAKQQTLNSLNQKITDLQTANAVYSQNESVIPDINTAIFTLARPDTLSKQILGLASQNSVTILSLTIGQATFFGQINQPKLTDVKSLQPLPNNAQSMPVLINIKGDYQHLFSFLTDLEKLRIPVKIDTATLSSSQLNGDNILTELINARVPYLESNMLNQ